MKMEPSVLATRFADAWNAHDMHAFADLFEEDARFVNVVGMFWKSRTEIEAAHRATHETIFRNSHFEIDSTERHALGDGCVALHARWRLSGLPGPDGKEGEREGILLLVARDTSTGWRIAVAQNTDIVAGVVAPPPHH
jgi:uncharacterized protein (TIGR02246 family)